MEQTAKSDTLPDDRESLERIKLQAEIRQLQETIRKTKAERGWNFPKTIRIALAILAGMSPVIFAGLNYRQEIRKYVHAVELEKRFHINQAVIGLFKDLSSGDPRTERIAALAMVSFGYDALPFLVEHLKIIHNIDTYATIITALRLIVNNAETPEEGHRRIAYVTDEMTRAVKKNMALLMAGDLGEIIMLEYQVSALGAMATDTRFSSKHREFIITELKAYKQEIDALADPQTLSEAANLRTLIATYTGDG
jgi:hypothetical protein